MRVRRAWLDLRRQALGPADGPARVALARITLRWLNDRSGAAELCKDALRVSPGLAEAARMLGEELHYVRDASGWAPAGENAAGGRLEALSPGMTAAEVRRQVGPPTRMARQIVSRRYLEQWSYDGPVAYWLEFNCQKGAEPRLTAIHQGRTN
jgi:hypothetical protein